MRPCLPIFALCSWLRMLWCRVCWLFIGRCAKDAPQPIAVGNHVMLVSEFACSKTSPVEINRLIQNLSLGKYKRKQNNNKAKRNLASFTLECLSQGTKRVTLYNRYNQWTDDGILATVQNMLYLLEKRHVSYSVEMPEFSIVQKNVSDPENSLDIVITKQNRRVDTKGHIVHFYSSSTAHYINELQEMKKGRLYNVGKVSTLTQPDVIVAFSTFPTACGLPFLAIMQAELLFTMPLRYSTLASFRHTLSSYDPDNIRRGK